ADLRPVNGPPVWLVEPTHEQIRHRHPPRAAEREKRGSVDLLCRVRDADGVLGCAIVGEDPPGWGFGEAALRVSDLYRIAPMVGGQPTRGRRLSLHVDFSDIPAIYHTCMDCGMGRPTIVLRRHWWWPF